MKESLTFQEAILRLNQFWADQGCLIWQPYNVQVGAGTMNPATVLRVLGPEPWNVAYVEPSVRPADGRYGENPNRWQQWYQYQVILKPDPGNPQEIFLESLEALGINRREHDIRFVEDNWASPALGAWGLGWEVWLDGQEITQFTYFQQAGGFSLDPVSVEITYGLERIMLPLQDVRGFPEIEWLDGLTYGDVFLRSEVEHCIYNFEQADVERLTQLYDLYEAEAENALERGLVIPAHDYVLKCSHTFNVLDSRGAVGVTERARYFARMRELARRVSEAYVKQREEMGFPLLKRPGVVAAQGPIEGTAKSMDAKTPRRQNYFTRIEYIVFLCDLCGFACDIFDSGSSGLGVERRNTMYLKQKDIFWAMSKDFVKEVMNISETESHKEGKFLFQEGDLANQFYILLKGRVKLSLGEIGQVVYVVSNAGEAFGWSSLTGRDAYTASAECLTQTKLLKWDKEKLQNVLEKDPANGIFFFKRLAELLGNRLVQRECSGENRRMRRR